MRPPGPAIVAAEFAYLLNPIDGFMRAAAIRESMAQAQAPIVLCGHTHLPGCYIRDGEQVRSVDVYRATAEPIALEASLAGQT